MKRLFRIAMLAVAFIATGVLLVTAAEAKTRLESRYMTIGGELQVVTESVSDSGRRTVVDVVDVEKTEAFASKKSQRPATVAKKEISPAPKKSERAEKNLNTATKQKEAPANNTASVNTAKKISENLTMSGANSVHQDSLNLKNTGSTAINTATPKSSNLNIPRANYARQDSITPINTAPNISAPYNTGAPDTSVISTAGKFDQPKSIAGPKKDGQTENTEVNVARAAEDKKVVNRVEYFLFDRRSYEELRQIAQNFRREEGGELIVQNLQDRTREDKVSKARFFEIRYMGNKPVHYREAYMTPTEALINFSESRRMPNSPGYQIKNKKS